MPRLLRKRSKIQSWYNSQGDKSTILILMNRINFLDLIGDHINKPGTDVSNFLSVPYDVFERCYKNHGIPEWPSRVPIRKRIQKIGGFTAKSDDDLISSDSDSDGQSTSITSENSVDTERETSDETSDETVKITSNLKYLRKLFPSLKPPIRQSARKSVGSLYPGRKSARKTIAPTSS